MRSSERSEEARLEKCAGKGGACEIKALMRVGMRGNFCKPPAELTPRALERVQRAGAAVIIAGKCSRAFKGIARIRAFVQRAEM